MFLCFNMITPLTGFPQEQRSSQTPSAASPQQTPLNLYSVNITEALWEINLQPPHLPAAAGFTS